MFGLGDDVGGDVDRGSAFTGDHYLRGAGEHVDCAVECDQALGSGYIQIAWADDLVDSREGCGSICQSCNPVRSTQAVELRDAEQMRRG